MLSFFKFLSEEAEGEKLKHITHAEDRPLQNGAEGFQHAMGALNQAHEHMKSGGHSSGLTMKYDGSPSIVFGHHPETGKFFVASKSAFNVNPKINYTEKDIEKDLKIESLIQEVQDGNKELLEYLSEVSKLFHFRINRKKKLNLFINVYMCDYNLIN